MPLRPLPLSGLLAAALLSAGHARAAAPDPALRTEIAAHDAEFFRIFFEGCDPQAVAGMLTEDLEFYHDKQGVVTRSAAPFVAQYAETCEKRKVPDAWRSRRELVADTLRVDPVPGYGAIEDGDHVFYERKGDGPEKLVGRAHFTQLWKKDGDRWKLARILSYAHEAVK